MEIKVINNRLIFNNSEIKLPFPVKKYLILNNIIIIMLGHPSNKVYNENIYALNEDGIVLWQIEPRDYLQTESRYVNIVNIGDGFIQANGWDSVIVKVNILNGKIISEEWVK